MSVLWRRVVVCVLILGLAACQKPDAIDSQGKPVYLVDYRNKWIVVNYWATWCEPCLTEMPELNQLYVQHQDKLVVLGINFDGLPNTEIQLFSKAHHLFFPLLSTFTSDKLGILDITTLPVTFIINPQGKLYKTLHGPQTQKSILQVISPTANNN